MCALAWIKGGAPGQIILCHAGTTDWLLADPIDGSLMAKLTSKGQPLAQGFSDVIIIDGKWHRVALVWDGKMRTLYMDGMEVAKDTQPQGSMTQSTCGMHIGVYTVPVAPMFWSGLPDDVRIYNRVVKP